MQIHQIQMAHDKLQDRILLRVSTSDRAELRFWLTRRYVKLLWEILLKMLERDPDAALHLEESTRRAVLDFQHQNAVQGGEFKKQFDENAATLPLGPEPVLLSRITAKPGSDGNQILAMHPEQGQGMDIAVNNSLLHVIVKLLADTVGHTEWDLNLAAGTRFTVSQQDQYVPPHKLN